MATWPWKSCTASEGEAARARRLTALAKFGHMCVIVGRKWAVFAARLPQALQSRGGGAAGSLIFLHLPRAFLCVAACSHDNTAAVLTGQFHI